MLGRSLVEADIRPSILEKCLTAILLSERFSLYMTKIKHLDFPFFPRGYLACDFSIALTYCILNAVGI